MDRAFESGEELETFEPRVLGQGGSGQEVDGKCSDEELDIRKVRSKPDKDVRVLVSVKEIIATDEKRSDLEYEVSVNSILFLYVWKFKVEVEFIGLCGFRVPSFII